MRSPWSIVIDLAFILVFAVVGRASHQEPLSVLGILGTAWPFLVAGLLASVIGWGLLRFSWWLQGSVVWLGTAFGGIMLRVVVGQGAAPAFIVVTVITLGVFLMGWRLVAQVIKRLIERRRSAKAKASA